MLANCCKESKFTLCILTNTLLKEKLQCIQNDLCEKECAVLSLFYFSIHMKEKKRLHSIVI